MPRSGALLGLALICLLPLSANAQAPDYAAIVAAPDRSDADRETDKRRDPTAASRLHRRQARHEGARYGRRLPATAPSCMARAVAPNGRVYAQDAGEYAERATEKFEARAKDAGDEERDARCAAL